MFFSQGEVSFDRNGDRIGINYLLQYQGKITSAQTAESNKLLYQIIRTGACTFFTLAQKLNILNIIRWQSTKNRHCFI